MSALGMASLGVLCDDRALGMATLGVICPSASSRGGKRFGFRRIVPDRSSVTREQLLREDEELIALVAAAIHEGIIP